MKSKSKMWKKVIGATVVAGCALAPVVSANAAAALNAMLIPGLNTIQDSSAERVKTAAGVVKTSGQFVVGDVIESILRFDTVNSVTVGDVLPSPYKFLAYSQLEVTAIVGAGGGACALATTCTLVFGGVGGGAVAASLYEGLTVANLPSLFSLAPALGIAAVTSQTLIATIGFGDPTDYWFSSFFNTGNTIASIAGLQPQDPQVPQGAFGISFLSNPGGIPYLPNAMTGVFGDTHDIVGNASIYAREPGTHNGWLVSDNLSASFMVPEPASLALVGLGLIGLAASRRRKI